MKSQLTQARAEIKTLENRIAQLHGHRKETEQLFEQEKNALKSTVEQNRNNVSICYVCGYLFSNWDHFIWAEK